MLFECLELDKIIGFDWDEGNILKNEEKHGLKWSKIEEVFFNTPLVLAEDIKHSQNECRCVALGKTDDKQQITVVFLVRDEKIRVISARPMHKKERKYYESY